MPLSQRKARLVGRLRRRKTREREGLVLVEGVRAARECLDAGADVRFAVISPRLVHAPGGEEVAARLEGSGSDLEHVNDAELAGLSDTEQPQGILLVAAQPPAGMDALREGGRHLVLDAVQDPGNVGTLVRAAAAFGLDAVVALEGTADPWGPKAVRASAGTAFGLPLVSMSAREALDVLGAKGVALLLADPRGAPVSDIAPVAGGFALIVGNEGAGAGEAVRSSAVRAVGLPMRGGVESLNVAVAGSILLYLLTEAGGGR